MPPSLPPKGVGGWLLFFCIQLLVAFLVTAGQTALVLLLALSGRFGGGRLTLVILAQTACALAVAVFGAIAGLHLWSVRPRAVKLTRVYLVLLAILPLVNAGLAAGFATTSALTPMMAVVMILGAAFWWAYFSHSRRVKATYGAAPLA